MYFARRKLVYDANVDVPKDAHSFEARVAVIDVRCRFSYASSHVAAIRFEEKLIATHMRILHAVSQSRDIIHSSYPSEPLLAEAAARQLECYRLKELKSKDMMPEAYAHPAITIAEEALSKELLDKEKVGEVCGSLLLTLAHDSVIVNSTQAIRDGK